MQHIIGAAYATQNVIIVEQIAPDDFDAGVALEKRQFFAVGFTRARNDADIEFVGSFEQFGQAGGAHVARRTGQKYSLLGLHKYLNE